MTNNIYNIHKYKTLQLNCYSHVFLISFVFHTINMRITCPENNVVKTMKWLSQVQHKFVALMRSDPMLLSWQHYERNVNKYLECFIKVCFLSLWTVLHLGTDLSTFDIYLHSSAVAFYKSERRRKRYISI